MQRIETAIKALRMLVEHKELSYTYDQILRALERLEFSYTEVIDKTGGKHLTLDFDRAISAHFTYENNHYEIPKYNLVHTILNELTKYYNEMDITAQIKREELDTCFRDLDMLKIVGITTWAEKKVAVHQVLKRFHDDEIVATLMFLKYIGGDPNRAISYIERHSIPVEHHGLKSEMCIELYNMNYYRMLTIDIDNCQIADDQFELVVNAFNRWYK